MDNNIHQDLVKLVEQLNNYNKKNKATIKNHNLLINTCYYCYVDRNYNIHNYDVLASKNPLRSAYLVNKLLQKI